MPIYCPKCKVENKDTARFCKTCGQALASNPIGQLGPTIPPRPYMPPAPPPVHNLTGLLPANAQVNNRYVIYRKVGQGGMAAIYEALDTNTQHRVALKEMSDAAITNPLDRPQALAQFRREAQMLANLNHPNLPRVMDFFEFNGKQYLVMDFVDGTPLDDMLQQNGGRPFPEPQVRQWATELCDVLSYLHAQQIIFRDLKPGNIMIDRSGHVKLVDFGIARLFRPGQTRDTQALGTMGYAAPEQLGTAQSDARTDIYALGVTLYELLTGYDPTSTPMQLPPLRQINAYVSPTMEQVINRAIAPNRNQRWQNVNEMRQALTGPLPATPFTPPGGQTPYVPTVVMGVGTGQSGVPPKRTSRPTTRLLLAAAQLSNTQLVVAILAVLIVVAAALWFGTPILMQYPVIWNNIASIAIVSPLIYTAVRRPFIAPIGHVAFSMLGVIITGARVYENDPSQWRIESTLVAALITAALIEVFTRFLPKVRGKNQDEAWQRELAWLCLMAVLVSALMTGLVWDWGFGLNPIMWISSSGLGALGWFIGDSIQQWLLFKQTGIKRGRGGH